MNYELDWLKRWSLYAPESVAIEDGDTGLALTYSNLYRAASSGARLLQTLGVGHGDRIAVLAMNELSYVTLFFAAQRLGAILVPMNYRLTQREVDHIVTDCKPKLIVHQPHYSDIVQKTQTVWSSQTILLETFAEQLQKHEPLPISFAAEPEDAAMIIYTSGTTGAPKGAVLSHRMLFWNSVNTTLRLNISQNDCTVIFLPFFHTGGWNVLTTPFLHRGAKVILLKKFDGDQILQLCESNKATILFGVPTTMDMMSRSPLFAKTNLSTLRYAIVGGEPMPIELIRTWHDKGVPIRQGFGLTEFGPNVFSLNEQDALRKIGSIGFPNFYSDVRIVNDADQECQVDEVGELLLKGPMCMTEYWQNSKATLETLQNGWLHTGDLVRRDPEGYFYVMGRKKDMYKSGGENVYPPELEKVLRGLPGIREVAVIGVPDAKWGEVGKAFIVVENNAPLNETSLLEYCQKNLAKFKIPKYFRFVPDLPKGDSGKILKRKLNEVYPD